MGGVAAHPDVRRWETLQRCSYVCAEQCLVDGGVAEHEKIRPAAFLIDGVDGLAHALVETRPRRRREMAAGGEAEHADPTRAHAEARRMVAHVAQRALRIQQRNLAVIGRQHAIAQHKRGNALSIQPLGAGPRDRRRVCDTRHRD